MKTLIFSATPKKTILQVLMLTENETIKNVKEQG